MFHAFVIFLSIFNAVENKHRFSGVIINEETKEPLPFAHVAVVGSSFGTVANNSGEFSILIPDRLFDDTLAFSFVGFETLRLPIRDLSQHRQITVSLSPGPTELPEIVIDSKEKSIIEQAIDAIPINHDQNQMRIRAFWRTKLENDHKYLQLSETSFDMYRHGKTNRQKCDLRILKGRIARDSVEMARLFNFSIGIGPDGLFNNSFLKDYFLLSRKMVQIHEFVVSDVKTYQERLVYEIKFNRKEGVKEYGYMGTILLDFETLAFWKISYGYSDRNTFSPPLLEDSKLAGAILGLNKSTSEKYDMEISFQHLNDRWYISHAYFEGAFFLRNEKRSLAEKFQYRAELAVSEIAKTGYTLPPKEEFARNRLLESQIDYSDAQFWSDYNYILPDEDFEQNFQELTARNN